MSDRRIGRRAERKPMPATRVAVWAITAAFGAYLVLTGILGILAKG